MIITLRLVEIDGVKGKLGVKKHPESQHNSQGGENGLEQAKGTEKEPEGNPQRRRD